MIYSEKYLKDLVRFQLKPSWLSLFESPILSIMLKNISSNYNDNILFINFSKKNLNYINIRGNKICIAIVENETEKKLVERIWNINHEFFDYVFTEFEFKNWASKLNMKFDKVIMNPPYNGNSNLYGKITLIAKKHAKDVICLSPYLNYLETVQKQSVKDVANQLLPFLKEYKLASTNSFDATFDKDLCIFYFSDDIKNPVDINKLYWNQFSNPELTKSIIHKVKNYSNFCYNKIISKKKFDEYEYKVAFTGVRGHCINGIKLWDWTTILDEEKMNNFNFSSDRKEDLMAFPFNNKNEAQNFVNWANDDIFGYLILIQKHSINMDKWLFKIIPYFDFSKKMIHEDYCKILNFTKEEDEYIKDEMKNFGWKAKK